NSILAMASIRFIALFFFLLAPGAWNFQCSDQGDKRNGICASSSSQTKTTVTDASNDPNNPTELNCNNTSDQTFCCASNAQKLNRQNNLSNNRGVDDITLCVLTVAAPRGGNTRELQKRGNTGFGSTGGQTHGQSNPQRYTSHWKYANRSQVSQDHYQ
ncbi:hypothetical protein PSTT_07790, partial [Puccinia striiformis]